MSYNSILQGLIKNSGLTQRELALKTGIHYAIISQIINGHITNPKHQKTIAKFFKKPIKAIFNSERRKKS